MGVTTPSWSCLPHPPSVLVTCERVFREQYSGWWHSDSLWWLLEMIFLVLEEEPSIPILFLMALELILDLSKRREALVWASLTHTCPVSPSGVLLRSSQQLLEIAPWSFISSFPVILEKYTLVKECSREFLPKNLPSSSTSELVLAHSGGLVRFFRLIIGFPEILL